VTPDTTLVVTALRGGIGGGTLASMMGQQDEVRASAGRRQVADDPYALSPDRAAEPDLGDERDLDRVRYDGELRTWIGPFAMSGINTRVVRRSKALQDWSYGRRFRYREVTGFGASPAAPGQGPGERTRRTGYFRLQIHTRTSGGARYLATIAAQGDPGYAATSVMLGESALCLALDRDRLPDRAGVLAPATAMGTASQTGSDQQATPWPPTRSPGNHGGTRLLAAPPCSGSVTSAAQADAGFLCLGYDDDPPHWPS
jgi:short subunit dehydrogenase-like uncharacterized protein